VAQSVDFGSKNRRKLFFSFLKFVMGHNSHMNTPIGDGLFQEIPRCVAKFRENRPRDVEKSVDVKFKLKCGSMPNVMAILSNI